MQTCGEQLLFVTGRLAEAALRRVVSDLAPRAGFTYEIQVLPISVAALLTTEWILPRLQIPDGTQRIIVPGYCRGDLKQLSEQVQLPVESGPNGPSPSSFTAVTRTDSSSPENGSSPNPVVVPLTPNR